MDEARNVAHLGGGSIVGFDQAKDAAAFAPLVDRYYAPLLRYLTRQTGDGELAADLTQASFLAAYRNRRQLATAEAFPGWLYQIARNEMRMEWRRRRLRRWVSLDWLPGPEGQASGRVDGLSRPDASGPCQERDLIQRVLDGLSPALREALLLHGLCGFTGGEVATILGISPAAARKRIARAEEAFRQRYRIDDDGPIGDEDGREDPDGGR